MASFILVIITLWYTYLTKKQVNYAHKSLEEENKRIKNAALNYAYLINSEMMNHKGALVIYLYDKNI